MTSSRWAFCGLSFLSGFSLIFFFCLLLCKCLFLCLLAPSPASLVPQQHSQLPQGRQLWPRSALCTQGVLTCTLATHMLIYPERSCKIWVGISEAWEICQMQDSTAQNQLWETSEVQQQDQSICIIWQLPQVIPVLLQNCWENIRACIGRNTTDHHLNEGQIK